jgi:ribonuclease VapC
MVIDSSVLVAILMQEPGWLDLAKVIDATPRRMISVATFLETSMVVEARKGPEGARDLDAFVQRAGIEIVPVDARQAQLARTAWRSFGKENHPASLNYGDLFSYALAKFNGAPLLYKGGDFSRTDIASALAP